MICLTSLTMQFKLFTALTLVSCAMLTLASPMGSAKRCDIDVDVCTPGGNDCCNGLVCSTDTFVSVTFSLCAFWPELKLIGLLERAGMSPALCHWA